MSVTKYFVSERVLACVCIWDQTFKLHKFLYNRYEL